MYKTPPKSPPTEASTRNLMRTPPNQCVPARTESDHDGRRLNVDQTLQCNTTQRNKRKCPSGEITAEDLETFKNEMKEMLREMISTHNSRFERLEGHMKEIKKCNIDIKSTINELEKSLTFLSDKLTSLENKITSLEKERNDMALKLAAVEEKLELYDRNSIKTSIEIRNVPKQEKETKAMLYDLVKSLAKQLDTSIDLTCIRDTIRQPSKRANGTSGITVEFSNTIMKQNFLAAVKEHNKKNHKLNSSHLGMKDTPQVPIYIAEQLTNTAKRLFYHARNYAKSHQYSFCWTSNGRVFLKKNADGQSILVKNEQQLKQLAQTISA